MIDKIGPLVVTGHSRSNEPQAKRPDGTFGEILAREAGKPEDVRLSAHAKQRLEARQIVLTENDRARLGNAVTRAGEKGANQSLVLLDDLALVVSVRNRVVITAMDETKTSGGVFTNIDSAVIA